MLRRVNTGTTALAFPWHKWAGADTLLLQDESRACALLGQADAVTLPSTRQAWGPVPFLGRLLRKPQLLSNRLIVWYPTQADGHSDPIPYQAGP